MEFCSQDGARLTAQVTGAEVQLAAGLARRFRIVRRLGAGGMGTVYLAEQIGVGNRPVALKVLNRKLLDDPEFLLRFQNEAGSTGRIHHANVVTIYESGQADDGTPYIAMEFLDGETLRDALKRRGALPVEECAEILRQTAQGLNAAHKVGIIHRDLKPDNIFLTQGDGGELLVKVVDFGIAKLRESATHTLTGMVLGTPAYMSAEQASGMRSDQLDLRSDVYSLGIVVYEMLTGSVPFHSDTPLGYLRKHMLEPPPPLRPIPPGLPVPPLVEAVVMKALAKDRGERFATALKFADDFARAVSLCTQTDPLPTTRVVEPMDWTQPPPEQEVQEITPAGREERPTVRAEYLAREEARRESQAPERAEGASPDKGKAGIEYIVREEPAPSTPRPANVPAPIPIRPAPRETPRPVSAPAALREPGKEDSSPRGQPAPPPPRQSRRGFFKAGFWILGVSQALMIVEGLVTVIKYSYRFGAAQWPSFLLEFAVGAAFTVIYCGFLARKRYSPLLWVSLVFAVLGTVANNIYWVALTRLVMTQHLTLQVIGILGMWRAFFTPSGLPLSSLVGPFVTSSVGQKIYLAVVVNIDCALKMGFLIWAIAKYQKPSPPSLASA
jgi:serine/threonine protein kinase